MQRVRVAHVLLHDEQLPIVALQKTLQVHLQSL
jgi:hypothetical protein